MASPEQTWRSNLERRLTVLAISPYTAARSYGMSDNWLVGMLRRDRSPSVTTLAKAGEAVGLPVHVLLTPGAPVSISCWPRPYWLMSPLPECHDSKPPVTDCQ